MVGVKNNAHGRVKDAEAQKCAVLLTRRTASTKPESSSGQPEAFNKCKREVLPFIGKPSTKSPKASAPTKRLRIFNFNPLLMISLVAVSSSASILRMNVQSFSAQ